MARIPTYTPPPRDAQTLRQQLREEYDTGLDKTGPQWEREDGELDAAVRAAGVTAYFPFGNE